MAFFMLMWLLNATTEKQRKGIADYFSPTIPVTRVSGGGDGSFGGDSVFTEETLAQNGTGGIDVVPISAVGAEGQAMRRAEDQAFSDAEALLMGMGGESMVTESALKHVLTRVTDEGLIIEIFDLEGEPLYEDRGAVPTAQLESIAKILADVFGLVTNEVALNGHIRAYPVVLAENPVWDLSSARADELRKLLEQVGLPSARVQRVTGFADRKPAVANPMATRNNRLEIILLRSDR